jgi:hypothetical protein
MKMNHQKVQKSEDLTLEQLPLPVVLPVAALIISVTKVPTMVEQNVNKRRMLTSLTAFVKASFVIVVVALHVASTFSTNIWEWDQ